MGDFFQPPSEWLEEDGYAQDYTGITVQDLLTKPKDQLLYEYDFGDSWDHLILLEKILEDDAATKLPVCLKGKLAAPPEDCGGIWGYYNLVEAISDKKHPEHQNILEWYGDEIDPAEFDIDEVNQTLQSIDFDEFEL